MGLKRMLSENPGYQKMDKETAQAIQEMVEEGMLRAGKYTDEEIASCSLLSIEKIRELNE